MSMWTAVVDYTLATKHALPEVFALLVESISGRFFFLSFFEGFLREKHNHTITEECPDCSLAKPKGNQLSGLGEDTFPK